MCRFPKAVMRGSSTLMFRAPTPERTSTSSRASAERRFPVTATDIAIVGVGKIARDQHVPSIGRSEAFNLVATVSSHDGVRGVENHATLEDLLAARPDIPAVALCMPPQNRFAAAKAALSAGRHVLLE